MGGFTCELFNVISIFLLRFNHFHKVLLHEYNLGIVSAYKRTDKNLPKQASNQYLSVQQEYVNLQHIALM